MSTQKIRRKRINFSIERPLQIRLIMKILLMVCLSILIIGGGFYFYTDQKIGETYQMAHFKMRTFRDFLFPAVLIFATVAALATSLLALFFPGRIAGPLYRTKKEMERLGDGDFKTFLAFRRGDELKCLAEAFNLMVGNLNERLLPLRKYGEEIMSSTEELSRIAEEGRLSDLKEKLRLQSEKGNQIKIILDQFKWKDELK